MKGGIIVDWNAIKAEYIAGGTSYRKLAEKHKVPRRTIEDRAKEENWVELRRQNRGKTVAKIVDAVSATEVDAAVEAMRLGNEASLYMLRQIANDAATGLLKETQITAYSRAIEQLRKNLGIKDEEDVVDTEINVFMGSDGEDYSV